VFHLFSPFLFFQQLNIWTSTLGKINKRLARIKSRPQLTAALVPLIQQVLKTLKTVQAVPAHLREANSSVVRLLLNGSKVK